MCVCVCVYIFADRRAGMCMNTSPVCMRSSSLGSWSTGESGVPSTTSPAPDANRCVLVCACKVMYLSYTSKQDWYYEPGHLWHSIFNPTLRVSVCVGVCVCRADPLQVPPRQCAVSWHGYRERLAWCRNLPLLQPEGSALWPHWYAQGMDTHTHTHFMPVVW